MKDLLKFSDETANALLNSKPVAALESTIISFGLPYPENFDTALECENILRAMGVSPATIWLDKGFIRAGATKDEIHNLSVSKNIKKTNLGNFSTVIACKHTGATTVATSITAASIAGIDVFATGGIGGVHRDFNETFDISSDLTALASNPVVVVCSGVKSILSIRATVEHLETLGIPVIGYKTDEFPGFYYNNTGFKVDAAVSSPEEVVEIYRTHKKVFPNKSLLVVNPCPAEFALPRDVVEGAIGEAMKRFTEDSKTMNCSGKNATPYMLKVLVEVTNNRTLSANLALIKNNVRAAGEIAKALCER